MQDDGDVLQTLRDIALVHVDAAGHEHHATNKIFSIELLSNLYSRSGAQVHVGQQDIGTRNTRETARPAYLSRPLHLEPQLG